MKVTIQATDDELANTPPHELRAMLGEAVEAVIRKAHPGASAPKGVELRVLDQLADMMAESYQRRTDAMARALTDAVVERRRG